MATGHAEQASSVAFEKGQRLHCQHCGSEIEIISPCTCRPSDQVFRCCGKDMTPSTGRAINLSDE